MKKSILINPNQWAIRLSSKMFLDLWKQRKAILTNMISYKVRVLENILFLSLLTVVYLNSNLNCLQRLPPSFLGK